MRIILALWLGLILAAFVYSESRAQTSPECQNPTPVSPPLDATSVVKFCTPSTDINGMNIPDGGLTKCVVDFVSEKVEVASPSPGTLVTVSVPSTLKWVGAVSAWCETAAGAGEVDGPYAARFQAELPGRVYIVP